MCRIIVRCFVIVSLPLLTLFVDGFAEQPTSHSMLGPRAARYRAASLTRAAMLYRHALKRGELPAEGTKDSPFCMDTYRFVVGPIAFTYSGTIYV